MLLLCAHVENIQARAYTKVWWREVVEGHSFVFIKYSPTFSTDYLYKCLHDRSLWTDLINLTSIPVCWCFSWKLFLSLPSGFSLAKYPPVPLTSFFCEHPCWKEGQPAMDGQANSQTALMGLVCTCVKENDNYTAEAESPKTVSPWHLPPTDKEYPNPFIFGLRTGGRMQVTML